MKSIYVGELSSSQESLLIPLWARSREASQISPILHDKKALELVKSIDYPFEKFQDAGVDTVGFCIRGAIIDQLLSEQFIKTPEMTVVELGVGLDTRFDRFNLNQGSWWEIDLPEAMAIRKKLFDEFDHRQMIAASALDTHWHDSIDKKNQKALTFVAEGMLYFLAPNQVRKLFIQLANRFPGARLIFDCQSPFFLNYNNYWQPIKSAKMLWSVRRKSDFARWDPRFVIEKYIGFGDPEYYLESHLKRLPLIQRIAARWWYPARHMFKICQVRLGDNA